MKILSKEHIYKGDEITAQRQNISSTELMERAGMQVFNWINMRMQGAQVPIHIFCGIGNNGGDGLVIARHLIIHGYNVKTYIVNYSAKRSKDFLINYDLIKKVSNEWPELLTEQSKFPEIHPDDIVLDAIFGIGLNKLVATWVKKLFVYLKQTQVYTVSVDIPSGLYTDKIPEDENAVVWAHYTLSFQAPKLVFFLPQTAKFITQWEVLDIGIDKQFLQEISTFNELIGKHEILTMYKPRERFSHKGNFGHVGIIGGSYGKIGSVLLAAKAALRIGTGMVTAKTPQCGYIPLQTAIPEVMVETCENERVLTDFNLQQATVCGVGVGLGQDKQTTNAFKTFLKTIKIPLVLDADALNILSTNNAFLKYLPEYTILTPHLKELERLIGIWEDDFDCLERVKQFSKKHKAVIVVKGAYTKVIYQEKVYVNTSGNQGMATAGSGDVLTGVITGLLAQGYDTVVAALMGVYLHGKAGDIAVQALGYQSLLAGDIVASLGDAYLSLFEQSEPIEKENNEEQE